MATRKFGLILEGDCPKCNTRYVFDNDDRAKGEILCTTCSKSFKIETAKNPIQQAVPQKPSPVAAIIMIPIMIGSLAFFWFVAIPWIDSQDDNSPPVLSQIDQCYKNAYDSYLSSWIGYCRVNGIVITKDDKGEETCNLPVNRAEELNVTHLTEKALCLARYK